MEALLMTTAREFLGVPYLVHYEDECVSDADVAWLRSYVFGAGEPVAMLAPDAGDPSELFRALYLDGNFLTEVVARLEPGAARDPALLTWHASLRRDPSPAFDCEGMPRASSPEAAGDPA